MRRTGFHIIDKKKAPSCKIFLHRLLFAILFCTSTLIVVAQPPVRMCDTLIYPGQRPQDAILICGDKPFEQPRMPKCRFMFISMPNHCRPNPLHPPQDTMYEIASPTYYKFKCYKGGTFRFTAYSIANIDWQLYDVTGFPSYAVIRNTSLIIGGNWSPNTGRTGTESPGYPFVVCRPINAVANLGPYSDAPTLIEGHEYILLIANYFQTSISFSMEFSGGTAVIKDPLDPHLSSAKGECNGTDVTIKVNKHIQCASLSTDGSEFKIITPGAPAITGTSSFACTSDGNFTELTLKLASSLTPGTYKVILQKGSDANTLLDNCGNEIPENEELTFLYETPVPVLADSVAKTSCTPDSIKLYFPRRISCSSISANGSDFSITGPDPVNIIAASGNCMNGKTDFVSIKFDKKITTKGTYSLLLKAGDDGSPIVDECGLPTIPQTINFTVADTVNADFIYSTQFGCQRDTLTFTHDAAHDVNNWKWLFNKTIVTTPTHTIIWPAKSKNQVKLIVSNGTCSDSTEVIPFELDNEVKSGFTMTNMICPEDKLEVTNQTIGNVDRWKWTYDIIGTSTSKDPLPFLFPTLNKEAYYSVKLVAYNDTYNCSDSIRKTLTVLDHCNIGVATAFTPNGDGLNDTFWPHNALKADNLEFRVLNRWGQLVFQSRTWRDKWDGTINGQPQPGGVYIWMLSYINRDTKKPVFQKGTVTLIR